MGSASTALRLLENHGTKAWYHGSSSCRFLHPVRGDARNFHAWKYRLWLVRRMGRSDEEELAFTQRLLEADRRNFSAWHYRSVLLPRVHAARGHRTLEELLADDCAVAAGGNGDMVEGSRSSAPEQPRPIPLYELQAELDLLHQVRSLPLVDTVCSSSRACRMAPEARLHVMPTRTADAPLARSRKYSNDQQS
jgi:Protein prenyltransferase alpha subunit repeat